MLSVDGGQRPSSLASSELLNQPSCPLLYVEFEWHYLTHLSVSGCDLGCKNTWLKVYRPKMASCTYWHISVSKDVTESRRSEKYDLLVGCTCDFFRKPLVVSVVDFFLSLFHRCGRRRRGRRKLFEMRQFVLNGQPEKKGRSEFSQFS